MKRVVQSRIAIGAEVTVGAVTSVRSELHECHLSVLAVRLARVADAWFPNVGKGPSDKRQRKCQTGANWLTVTSKRFAGVVASGAEPLRA